MLQAGRRLSGPMQQQTAPWIVQRPSPQVPISPASSGLSTMPAPAQSPMLLANTAPSIPSIMLMLGSLRITGPAAGFPLIMLMRGWLPSANPAQRQPSAKRPREDGYPEGGAASRPSSKQPSRKQSPLPEGSKPAQPSKGSKGEVSRSQEPSSRDRSRSRGRPRSRSQEPQRASAQLDGLPSRASQDADPSSYPRERDSSRDRRSPGRTAQRGSEPLEKQVNGPKEPPPLREATASPAPPGFSRKAGHEPVGEVPASQKRSQLPDKASDQPRKSGAVTGIVQTLRDTDK